MRSILGGRQEVEECGAKTRSGRPCKNAGMRPSGRCRMHGGKSYRGIASPRYKHGRYSKVWLARFMAMLRDEPEKARAETERILAELAAQVVDVESLINQPNPLEGLEWDPAVFEGIDLPLDFDPAVFDLLDLSEDG